jgi:predicted transcriptional regulator
MTTTVVRNRVIDEINAVPDEYLPYVLQLVQTFRESIALKPAAASIAQGWREAQSGQVTPVEELWNDIDSE